jgi:uridine phosphorylase
MKKVDSQYPILEFDPCERAIIEPSEIIKRANIPEHCIFCYFPEVIDQLKERSDCTVLKLIHSIMGDHELIGIKFNDHQICVLHPGMGAPLAANFLEQVIALGCRKFIVCGIAAVLDSTTIHGKILVPSVALRDEGTSYHYLQPAREVAVSSDVTEAITTVLDKHRCPFQVIKTWTTDAFFRETYGKVRKRRDEGCAAVEMEAAAFFAVAEFRKVKLGQLMFAGDDVSGIEWDRRENHSRDSIREKLF